ncbi:MAG: poly-beta-1,6-N-acetyl-D-glucosamine biosynthesis protein PgaD [Gemmatimonadales bacterium]|nr:MAG: poly-beta-1,6-N-acetyl-D-glucosamine biosynthesis protein PgaD [Gemmatimonadales bacterium]
MKEPTKPRTGLGSETELIFDRPELQARRHRWAYTTLTLIAWVVWMYLWLPLITLLAWYFGIRALIREAVIPDPGTVLSIAAIYLLVVAILGGILIGWSRYNLRRFGGKDRRKEARGVPASEVAAHFGIREDTLADMRAGRSLVLSHSPGGRVSGVEMEGRSGRDDQEEGKEAPSHGVTSKPEFEVQTR